MYFIFYYFDGNVNGLIEICPDLNRAYSLNRLADGHITYVFIGQTFIRIAIFRTHFSTRTLCCPLFSINPPFYEKMVWILLIGSSLPGEHGWIRQHCRLMCIFYRTIPNSDVDVWWCEYIIDICWTREMGEWLLITFVDSDSFHTDQFQRLKWWMTYICVIRTYYLHK
jgi:hypothetical protein